MHHFRLSQRRLAWLLVTLLMLGGSVTACTATNEQPALTPNAISAPTTADAPPTLTLWHSLPREEATLLRTLATSWAAARSDGATIQLQAFDDEDELNLKLGAAIQSEVAPTLAFVRPADLATYIEANAVLPLDPMMASGPLAVSDDEAKDIYANFFDAVRFRDGQLYAWPVSRDQTLLLVNHTRIEALGGTLPVRSWDDLVRLCQLHMSNGGLNCLAAYPTGNVVGLWIWAHGGQVLNAQGTAPLFQGEGGKQVLDWLAQLRAVNGVIAANDYEAKVSAFTTGNSLFAFDSTAELSAYEGRINSQFDMVVMPPPTTNGQPLTVATGENVAIFRGSPAQEALAWDFVRYLTNAQNNEEWADVARAYPIRRSSVEAMDERWPTFSRMRQAAPWLAYARAEPMVAAWRDVQQVLSDAMLKTIAGEEMPEAALEEAARRCEGLLR